MKHKYTLKKFVSGFFFSTALGLLLSPSVSNAQQVTYSFATCGVTGSVGPTQAQVNTFYATTNLNGSVTISGQGIQQFTIPVSGPYQITAAGSAAGGTIGNYGHRGRIVQGEIFLTAGTVLKILVGQKGITGSTSTGGGGGTYVSTITNSAIIVAGGGGGYCNIPSVATPSSDANYATNGSDYTGTSGGGTGGTNGNGGNGVSQWGGGGGGFNGNGTQGSSCANTGGMGFVNGGMGGGTCNNSVGGFGGGGGTHGNTGGGGGGGGYSGGGGSGQTPSSSTGGGGGSYQSPNMTNTQDLGLHTNEGYVIIMRMCALNISASAPNGTTNLCPGTSVTLTTDGVSGINWSTGGTGTTVVVSPTSTSIYSVSATTSANCIGYSQVNLIVNPNPTVNITSTVSVFCKGGSATLFGTGATTYSWNTGATTSSITVTPTSTTIYTVTGANQFSCVNTNTYQVNVFSPTVAISGPTAICLGQSATFNASSSNSYSWSTGWTGQMLTVSPNTSTSYSLSITSTSNNILCAAGTSVLLVVNPNPTVSASSQPANVCKGQTFVLSAGGASTYSWSTGAATSSVSTNESQPGIYTYTVTGTNAEGCSSTAQVQVAVNSCSGIQELGSARVQVYPNPSKGVVTIQGQKALQVEVLNALGQRIKTIRLGVENAYRAELNGLSSGLYFVQAEGVSTRLIVE